MQRMRGYTSTPRFYTDNRAFFDMRKKRDFQITGTSR